MIVTPQDEVACYSENLVCLPHCYLANDNTQAISDKDWQKADFGLPDDGLVFCSFNHAFKIEPTMLDVWMNISCGEVQRVSYGSPRQTKLLRPI
jgi:protein O-GlcNAc transferase